MFTVVLILFHLFAIGGTAREEFVPTLLWTSQGFQDRPSLGPGKIPSDTFDSHLGLVLSKSPTQTVVVVLLEEHLSVDDFEWRDESGYNAYPFLNNLSIHYRVDYLKEVESPYNVTLERLKKANFQTREWQPDSSLNFKETAFIVEFDNDKTIPRPELLKRHDEVVEGIYKRLKKVDLEWICLYTAKSPHQVDSFGSRIMSSWHVKEALPEKSPSVLSLYRDEYTGLTLMVRRSVQLYLPSVRNFAVVHLENYSQATEKRVGDNFQFTVRFTNYTLTFGLGKGDRDRTIESVTILNDNDDSLVLTPSSRNVQPRSPKCKCLNRPFEFRNVDKPLIKVKMSKYKFVRLPFHEEPCTTPYNFYVISSFMLMSIVMVVLIWDSVFKHQDFDEKSKIVKISSESLFPFTFAKRKF